MLRRTAITLAEAAAKATPAPAAPAAAPSPKGELGDEGVLGYQLACLKQHFETKSIYRSRVERTDMSYKSIWSYAAQVGRGWVENGLKPGERVLIMCDTTVEPLMLQLSTILAGGEAVMLNPAGLSPPAVEAAIEQLRPSYIVFRPQIQSPSPNSPTGVVTTDMVHIMQSVFPEYLYAQLGRPVSSPRYPFVKQILSTVVPKQPDHQQAYGFYPARRLLKDSVIPDNYYQDMLRYNWNQIKGDSSAVSYYGPEGKLTTLTHTQVVNMAQKWQSQIKSDLKVTTDDRVAMTSGHQADQCGILSTWGGLFSGVLHGYSNPHFYNKADAEKMLKGVPAHRATIFAADVQDAEFLLSDAHLEIVEKYVSREDWSVKQGILYHSNGEEATNAAKLMQDRLKLDKVSLVNTDSMLM